MPGHCVGAVASLQVGTAGLGCMRTRRGVIRAEIGLCLSCKTLTFARSAGASVIRLAV
jgi:hypothetical protein